MRKKIALIILTVCLSVSARPPEESEFLAASILGEEMANWLHELERRPSSLGIFSIHSNYPLEQDYSTILETEIMKSLAKKGSMQVTSCSECRNPQVSVSEDRVVISKGAPDIETLKRIGKKQPVETFMVIEVYRSKMSVVAHAVLYQNPTGVLISAERFKVPALNFTDAAVQVLFTVGGGKMLSGKGADGLGFTNSGSLTLLEEIGFGKGGLGLGAVLGGSTLIYLCPTLAFGGRFGTSSMGYSINLGLGYGFASEARGITAKGSYEVFLGSLTVVGADLLYFIPDKSVETFGGYGGFHIGIALGK